MAYKPSRSSSVMFHKYKDKERDYLKLRDSLIHEGGTFGSDDIKAISKYIYLAFINSERADKDLLPRSYKPATMISDFYLSPYARRVFKMEQYKHLVYKPLLPYLND